MPRLAEMQRIGKVGTRHAGSVAQIDRWDGPQEEPPARRGIRPASPAR